MIAKKGYIAIKLESHDPAPSGIVVSSGALETVDAVYGTVEASTPPVTRKGTTVHAPKVGERVVALIGSANIFDLGDGGEIAVFGSYTQAVGETQACDWWEGILAVIDDLGFKATGDNVILRVQLEDERTSGGIYLPDTARRRAPVGEVVSAGPLAVAEGVAVGETWVYNKAGVPDANWGHAEEFKGLVFCPVSCLQVLVDA